MFLGEKKKTNLGFSVTDYLPLPNSQFCPKWDVSINVDLREG